MKQLVLLYGWGASRHIWHRQVEAWGDKFSSLTPDIPEWDARWLVEYLSGMGLAESILVGWSLGGMLLLEALARWSGPPPAATVLVGATASFCRRPEYPWGQPPALVRAMRLGLRSDPGKVLRDFAQACLAPGEVGFREEAEAGFDQGADSSHLARGLDYLKDKDLRGLLPNIGGQVVIIHGEQDGIVAPAQARFLHEQLSGSELRLLANAGHLPFLTQAEAFDGILKELLLNL